MLKDKDILEIRKYLNKNYSLKLSKQLDTFNPHVDQALYDYLWQAFKFELNISQYAKYSDASFQSALQSLTKKLKNGYNNRIVNLLNIALKLKDIWQPLPIDIYNSQIYDEVMDNLQEFLKELGVSNNYYEPCDFLALFQNMSIKPNNNNDEIAIQIGKDINYYLSKNNIANQTGLAPVNGNINNFEAFRKPLIGYILHLNNLPINLDYPNLPNINHVNSIIPVQEALYLKGYCDNIAQNFNRENAYSEALDNFKLNDLNLLLSASDLHFNVINLKQKWQAILSDKLENSNYLNWNSSVKIDNFSLTSKLLIQMHPQIEFSVNFEKPDLSSDTLKMPIKTIPNSTFSHVINHFLVNNQITDGTVYITLKTDPDFMNELKLIYNIQITSVNNLPVSHEINVKLVTSFKYDQFKNYLEDLKIDLPINLDLFNHLPNQIAAEDELHTPNFANDQALPSVLAFAGNIFNNLK